MSAMGTEMVDIYVSPSKPLSRLYKSKLCARIPYFNKMFNGAFKEATENTAYLLEDTTSSFDLLADWTNHPTTTKCPRKIRDSETVTDENGRVLQSGGEILFGRAAGYRY
ncbi:hypothetical protein L207DRAFT_590597 [Hyaloscypha variabilis F]|uniref:BTB domain-containing protein n=1 Tax=Hyaloscypha variabilis (strain UAMH 11265 / GT02V1 / F) TaxID=1149755 RepID=A0A2J6R1B3_HYAVF|nr:hypothetical protein L207DRAFT_590597 [Hyaloscypha variabilis F]